MSRPVDKCWPMLAMANMLARFLELCVFGPIAKVLVTNYLNDSAYARARGRMLAGPTNRANTANIGPTFWRAS